MEKRELSSNQLTEIIKRINSRKIDFLKYKDYYYGRHALKFTSDKFRTRFGKQLRKFCDNLCKTVVKAPANRLRIESFTAEKNKDVYNESWQIWKRSKMPKFAKDIHRDAFIYGEAFLSVWIDDKKQSRFYYENPFHCAAWYNDLNEIDYAAKMWKGNDDYFYLTVYFPDRTEKYISKRTYKTGDAPATISGFKQRKTGDGSDADLSHILENDTGKIPLFHFKLETSILDDVIPLNDALNKEICDLLIASEANSMRRRWSTGISYPIDAETNKAVPPFDENTTLYSTEKIEGKFGEFGEITLSEILKVVEDFRFEIARVSGVPASYFLFEKANFPSGEAQKRNEERFISLITDAQDDFGEVWADAMRFAFEIENEETKAEQIETLWIPAAQMSEREKYELAALKRAAGVSEKRVLSELGYSDADIEQFQKDNAEQKRTAAETFGKIFDSGNIAGTQNDLMN